MTDKFIRIAPRLDDFANSKEIRPGMTEKDVAKKLSDIYFDYTHMGLYIPNDSAMGAGTPFDAVEDMLTDIRNAFGVSLLCFNRNLYGFWKMGADEVLKLIVAEIRANQANKVIVSTTKNNIQNKR